MYQNKLIKIIGKKAYDDAFKCIKDIINNNRLYLDRFTEGSHRPNRQKITLFLASWCKLIGLNPEDYREWLIDYCVDVLSAISSSKPSQIRHSTKSIIKYIHRSDVQFICNCEHNILKAACSKDCPIYEKMHDIYLFNLEEKKKLIEKYQNVSSDVTTEPVPVIIPRKKKYKEQFDKAITLIKQYLDKGYTKQKIAVMLNEEGYKTSTGYEWKLSTITRIAEKNDWIPEHKKRNKKDSSEKSAFSAKKISIRKKYKEQFDKAISLIKQYLEKGHTYNEIVTMLNEEGYKTSAGFVWTPNILSNVVIKNNFIYEHKKSKNKKN